MIKTDRTIWTLLERDDLKKIHQLQSIPKVERFNTLGIPKDFEATKKMMTPLIDDNIAGKSLTFTVRNHDHEIIGLFAVKKFPSRYQAVEVWYKYFPQYWGHGFGTEMLKAFIKYGFEEMKLHRIEAGCAVDHIASIRVFEKAGLIREGRSRKTLPLTDGWSDQYTYAILEEDYFGTRN